MPSRPFDPQWTTDAPQLTAHLRKMCKQLTLLEGRDRARPFDSQVNFEASIKAIALDLYRANQTDPALEVGIASGSNTLQKMKQSRYAPNFISARSFQDALRILNREGLVLQTTREWHEPNGANNRTARYQASETLLQGLARKGASIALLSRYSGAEGIFLKDGKKRLVEYGDVEFANGARDRLQQINKVLSSHWMDLAVADDELSRIKCQLAGTREDEGALPFDFSARSLHRVFNNNDWEQGGRFYGAWWMAIPSDLRKYILIDGKRTTEVDYSGLHANMLYAMEGIDAPSDPYDLGSSKYDPKSHRKLVKRTFNALLNYNGKGQLGQIDGFTEAVVGVPWHEFRTDVVKSYPEFSKYFGSGVGLRLQYKDSVLAERVMLKFASMDYPCLPVHDSFLVHHELREELTEVMQTEFERMFGVTNRASFKKGIGEAVSQSVEPIQWTPTELETVPGYEQRLRAFREKHLD